MRREKIFHFFYTVLVLYIVKYLISLNAVLFSQNMGNMIIIFNDFKFLGVALMRFYDETLNDNLKTAYVQENMSANQLVKVDEVQFNLNESVKEKIETAKKDHMERYNSVKFNFMLREGFGKADCKKAKVGPDAVMQLGFQIGMPTFHIHTCR